MQTDKTKSNLSESEALEKDETNIEFSTVNTDANFTLIDTIVIPNNVEDSNFVDFDLKDLLIKAPYGNSILKYYAKNDLLNFSLRTTLVNIIARHL